MTSGPVEYVVFRFPENEFTAKVADALRELMRARMIRLLDFIFIEKNRNGDIRAVEFEDVTELAAFTDVDGEVGGLIGLDDIEYVAQDVASGCSIALLIWEELWAAPLLDALTQSDAALVEGAHVPSDLLNAAMSDVR